MLGSTKTNSLLFRLCDADSSNGISRATLKKLAAYFDVSDTQVVHYALRKLASEVLPAYEADEGPLSDIMVKSIRTAEPQDKKAIAISSLFE